MEYNGSRPHQGLAEMTPSAFAGNTSYTGEDRGDLGAGN
jgi:hypothetical protein